MTKTRLAWVGLILLSLLSSALFIAGAAQAVAAPPTTKTLAFATTNDPTGAKPTSVTVKFPQTLYTKDITACGPPVWLQVDVELYDTPAHQAIVDKIESKGTLTKGEDSSVYVPGSAKFVLIKACAVVMTTTPPPPTTPVPAPTTSAPPVTTAPPVVATTTPVAVVTSATPVLASTGASDVGILAIIGGSLLALGTVGMFLRPRRTH